MTTRDPNETVHVRIDNLGLTVLEKLQALETTVGRVLSQLIDKLYHSTPTTTHGTSLETLPLEAIAQEALPVAEEVAVDAAEHEL